MGSCAVVGTGLSCLQVEDGAKVSLGTCELKQSQRALGVDVDGEGSEVALSSCKNTNWEGSFVPQGRYSKQRQLILASAAAQGLLYWPWAGWS